ncbi:MAG: hypothetical protein SFY69_11020 [Planctomycetota bacterium]|nr:hypothetical protein [Planctomycetota bacterium]
MRSLLHVFDAGASTGACARDETVFAAMRACAALREIDTARTHRALVLGGTDSVRHARGCALRVDARIAPPAGVPRLARRGVERVLDMMDPDGVVWWSAGVRRALSATPGLPSRRLLVRLDEGSCEARVVNPESGELTSCRRTLAPGPTGLPAPRPRRARRAGGALRIGLVGATPDSPAALTLVIGILTVAGIACEGVADARTPGMDRAERHVREGGYLRAIRVADGPAASLFDACDVVLMAGLRGAEPSFAAWCDAHDALAWGVPVIVPPLAGAASLGGRALLTRADRPSEFARVIRERFASGHAPEPTAPAGGASIAGAIEAALHELGSME